MTQTHRQALPKGYRLHEYQLDRVLGSGGFGLTYLAWDTSLDKPVAIKEYLPNDLAVRETDHSVMPKSGGNKDDFQWGLGRFLDEARTLARFKHPNIIAVYRYFEAHNTAYIVMEFAEGETLDEVLKRGVLEEPRLLSVLMPLLEGLEEVHGVNFLHRDIKPGNIVIRSDGSPVLLDFGAARQAVGSRSRNITSVVTPGYAPIEQYSTRGNQGPWTDIYALGAVAYEAVSGEAPLDATGRVFQDPMRPASEICQGKYSESLLNSIDWALSMEGEARPQDIASWRQSMTGEAAPPSVDWPEEPVPVREGSPEPKPESKPERKRRVETSVRQRNARVTMPDPVRKHRTGLVAMIAVLLLVTVIGGGYLYLQQQARMEQQAWMEQQRRQAISACQESYFAGNHQSVIDACQTLAKAGVAEAVSVIARSEVRQKEKEAAAEEAERLRAGRVFRDCADCPEMVVIPAGRFRMGDLNGGGGADEKPVHEVRIAKPFAMGRYEVTFAEYDRYAQATGKTKPDDEGWGRRGNHPVINVSWQDAQGYAKWLSQETGQRYRLPSEAEWEYAARAGSTTIYYWGNSPSGRHANADEDDGWPSDGYELTAPTGSFIPNQFGLYDMSGNVWEWVEDCRRKNYRGAPVDGSAWVSGGDCDGRVLRGGSFNTTPAGVRSAHRAWVGAVYRLTNFGFRLARTL